MGSFSLMHWVIVLLVVMLLFGGGRISGLMGDVAKGIKSFKKGMADDEEPQRRLPSERAPEAPPAQPQQTADPARPAEVDRNQA